MSYVEGLADAASEFAAELSKAAKHGLISNRCQELARFWTARGYQGPFIKDRDSAALSSFKFRTFVATTVTPALAGVALLVAKYGDIPYEEALATASLDFDAKVVRSAAMAKDLIASEYSLADFVKWPPAAGDTGLSFDNWFPSDIDDEIGVDTPPPPLTSLGHAGQTATVLVDDHAVRIGGLATAAALCTVRMTSTGVIISNHSDSQALTVAVGVDCNMTKNGATALISADNAIPADTTVTIFGANTTVTLTSGAGRTHVVITTVGKMSHAQRIDAGAALNPEQARIVNAILAWDHAKRKSAPELDGHPGERTYLQGTWSAASATAANARNSWRTALNNAATYAEAVKVGNIVANAMASDIGYHSL